MKGEEGERESEEEVGVGKEARKGKQGKERGKERDRRSGKRERVKEREGERRASESRKGEGAERKAWSWQKLML